MNKDAEIAEEIFARINGLDSFFFFPSIQMKEQITDPGFGRLSEHLSMFGPVSLALNSQVLEGINTLVKDE